MSRTFSKLADKPACRSKNDIQCRGCQDYSSKQRFFKTFSKLAVKRRAKTRTQGRRKRLLVILMVSVFGQSANSENFPPNSWVVTEVSEDRHQHTKPVCISEPSEYSRDSLGVGNNVSVPSFSWLKSMSQIVGLTATWQDKVEGNPMGANTASNAKVNISPVHTEFNFFL